MAINRYMTNLSYLTFQSFSHKESKEEKIPHGLLLFIDKPRDVMWFYL